MDIKKVILLAAVLMIAISSLSMVTAGWFDSGNSAETGEVNGVIKSSSLKAVDIDGGATFQGSFNNPTSSVDANISGKLKINLENATDNQIKYIQDNIDKANITTEFNAKNLETTCTPQPDADINYTINNNTLTVKFDKAAYQSSAKATFIYGKNHKINVNNATVTIPTDSGNITVVASK